MSLKPPGPWRALTSLCRRRKVTAHAVGEARLLRSPPARRNPVVTAAAALTILSSALNQPAAAEAAALTLPTQVSGVYLGAWHLGVLWQRYLGVPQKAIFADPGRAREMLRAVAQDAKNIGFNTLILSSFFYPKLTRTASFPVNFPYSELYGREGFVELTAQEAARAGLSLIVALSPEEPIFDNKDVIGWVRTCEDTPWARRQVEHYARLPAVKGVLCAFEAWGRPEPQADACATRRRLSFDQVPQVVHRGQASVLSARPGSGPECAELSPRLPG